MQSGRARLGSSNLLEPITALDEIELAQQLKKRQLTDIPESVIMQQKGTTAELKQEET